MTDKTPVHQNQDPAIAPERTLKINPIHMGYNPDLNYDKIESLIEYAEGEQRR